MDGPRWAFRFKLLFRFSTGCFPQAQQTVTAEWNAMAAGWESSDVRATNEESLALLEHVLRDLDRPLQPMRVLDFGCGTGVLVELLQPRCESVLGLDAAPMMVAHLQDKIARRGWPNVEACCAVLGSDDHPPPAGLRDCVDLIVASTVLQWIPSVERTLAALCTLLKPEGLLVHFEWPSPRKNYRAGFNEASARALYQAAGLEAVSMQHRGSFFIGVARAARVARTAGAEQHHEVET